MSPSKNIEEHPKFKEMEERWKTVTEQLEKLTRQANSGTENVVKIQTPTKSSQVTNDSNLDKLKSQSDSTLYEPAVQKELKVAGSASPLEKAAYKICDREDEILDTIRNIRIDTTGNPERNPSGAEGETGTNRNYKDRMEQAKKYAEEAIVAAERQRANIATANAGRSFANSEQFTGFNNVRSNDMEDDEFFHVTCHVELSLKQRIRRGEFVELEKLLQKNRQKRISDELKMELVHRDGQTFFAPSEDKESKISSVRKWEQAFRVYAAIYSKANPTRAAEIWQYVHVINVAAASYAWENVAYYDYTFRQLMAANPSRSWAKTYNQMWNMAMVDPLSKSHGTNYGRGTTQVGQKRDHNGQTGTCWKFNKNKCKHGPKCRFEHKCSYCGSHNHSAVDCRRRGKKSEEGNGKRTSYEKKE